MGWNCNYQGCTMEIDSCDTREIKRHIRAHERELEDVPEYAVAPDRDTPDSWRVEAILKDGAVYVAIFTGPLAEARAREYAFWKRQNHY